MSVIFGPRWLRASWLRVARSLLKIGIIFAAGAACAGLFLKLSDASPGSLKARILGIGAPALTHPATQAAPAANPAPVGTSVAGDASQSESIGASASAPGSAAVSDGDDGQSAASDTLPAPDTKGTKGHGKHIAHAVKKRTDDEHRGAWWNWNWHWGSNSNGRQDNAEARQR